MKREWVDYECDGHLLHGRLIIPEADVTLPGVLVAHDATGVNDHVNSRVAALADLGYAAFAIDLYGSQGFSRNEAAERHQKLFDSPGLVLRRAMAGLWVLAAQSSVDSTRLAAIGFCQGGITVLELARANAPILAAIGFHPGYVRPAGSQDMPIEAKVLMMSGTADPYASMNDFVSFSEEMTAKGCEWQLHLFGGVGHAFTDPAIDSLGRPGMTFNAHADRTSWAMMKFLLSSCFQAKATSQNSIC